MLVVCYLINNLNQLFIIYFQKVNHTIKETGIPYEMQKDLFSLAVKSTFGTRNEKGVGLGLSLCKEFTELQNGNIWFESVSGKGTRFFISFKLASAIA